MTQVDRPSFPESRRAFLSDLGVTAALAAAPPDPAFFREQTEGASERGRPARILAPLQRPITLADAVRFPLTSGS